LIYAIKCIFNTAHLKAKTQQYLFKDTYIKYIIENINQHISMASLRTQRFQIITKTETIDATEFTLNLPNSKALSRKEIVYCVDSSKFMDPTMLETATKSLKELISTQLPRSSSISHDILFTFSEGTRSYYLDNNSFQITHKQNEELNICILMDTLIGYLSSTGSSSCAVLVIILAGVETVCPRIEIINRLRMIYAICAEKAIQIHSIGVDNAHDSYFLDKITRSATLPSSYQYVETVDQMRAAIGNLLKLINRFSVSAHLPLADKKIRMHMREIGDSSVLKGYIFGALEPNTSDNGNPSNRNAYGINISSGRGFTEMTSVPTINSQMTIIEKCNIMLEYIYIQMYGLVLYITNNIDDAGLQSIERNIKMFNDLFDEIGNNLYSVSPIDRKYTINQYLSLRNIILFFNNALGELKQTNPETNQRMLSISTFGKLQNSIYSFGLFRDNTISTFDKEINEYISTNSEELMKLREIEDDNGKKPFDPNDPTALTTPATDHQPAQNYLDLLQKGDVLCIRLSNDQSLDLVSAETAILDYLINNSSSPHYIIPLYINSHHWYVAQRKIRQLLAIISASDQNAYSPQMLEIIPFKLLDECIKALFASPTATNAQKYKLLLESCKHIMQMIADENPDFISTLLSNLKLYSLPGSKIRLDIEDNNLFATHVFVATMQQLAPKFKRTEDVISFFMCMLEEQTRRNMTAKYGDLTPAQALDTVWKLINTNPKYYADHIKLKNEYNAALTAYKNKMTGGSHYAKFIIEKFQALGQPINMDDKVSHEKAPIEPDLSELPNIDKDIEDDGIFEVFNNCMDCSDYSLFTDEKGDCDFIRRYIKLCSGADVLKSPENVFSHICMILQNIIQCSKTNRAKAIDANSFSPTQIITIPNYIVKYERSATLSQYIDFVGEYGFHRSIEWIRGVYSELTHRHINANIIQPKVIVSKGSTEELTTLFATTENIYEAVGIIFGSNWGHDIHLYLKALQLHGVTKGPPRTPKDVTNNYIYPETALPFIYEKLEVLATGKFKKVLIIPDFNAFSGHKTNIRLKRKHLNKLIFRNKSSLTLEHLQTLFPESRMPLLANINPPARTKK